MLGGHRSESDHDDDARCRRPIEIGSQAAESARTARVMVKRLANGMKRDGSLHLIASITIGRTINGVEVFDELTRRLLLLHDQMEQLLCALDIQHLVLANSKLRWLPAVAENVEVLVAEIKLSETERLPVARSAAAELYLDPEATLAQLADAVDDPHRSSWRRIRTQLVELQQEIEQIASSSSHLGQQGASAANDVMSTLGGSDESTAYSATGQTELARPTPHRFDRTA